MKNTKKIFALILTLALLLSLTGSFNMTAYARWYENYLATGDENEAPADTVVGKWRETTGGTSKGQYPLVISSTNSITNFNYTRTSTSSTNSMSFSAFSPPSSTAAAFMSETDTNYLVMRTMITPPKNGDNNSDTIKYDFFLNLAGHTSAARTTMGELIRFTSDGRIMFAKKTPTDTNEGINIGTFSYGEWYTMTFELNPATTGNLSVKASVLDEKNNVTMTSANPATIATHTSIDFNSIKFVASPLDTHKGVLGDCVEVNWDYIKFTHEIPYVGVEKNYNVSINEPVTVTTDMDINQATATLGNITVTNKSGGAVPTITNVASTARSVIISFDGLAYNSTYELNLTNVETTNGGDLDKVSFHTSLSLSLDLNFYKDSVTEGNKITTLESGNILGNVAVTPVNQKMFGKYLPEFIMATYRDDKLIGVDTVKSNILFYDDFNVDENEFNFSTVRSNKWTGTTTTVSDKMSTVYGINAPDLAGEPVGINKGFQPDINSTLMKTFGENINGLYEAYFYDSAALPFGSNNRGAIWVSGQYENTGINVLVQIGLPQGNTDPLRQNYHLRIDARNAGGNDDIHICAARSIGWHKLSLDFRSGEGFQAYIDDVLVYPNPANPAEYDPKIKSFDRVALGTANWSTATGTYFDNAIVKVDQPMTLSIPNVQDGDVIKWFTWEGLTSMKPIINGKTFDITGLK